MHHAGSRIPQDRNPGDYMCYNGTGKWLKPGSPDQVYMQWVLEVNGAYGPCESRLSVCLFLRLSVSLSVYLSICLPLCLSVCLSVSLSLCVPVNVLLLLIKRRD